MFGLQPHFPAFQWQTLKVVLPSFCVCVYLHISDSLGLHRVENVSHTECAASLHLYSPPFQTCQTFDQRTGHRNTVKMTFTSKYGEKIPFVRDSLSFAFFDTYYMEMSRPQGGVPLAVCTPKLCKVKFCGWRL